MLTGGVANIANLKTAEEPCTARSGFDGLIFTAAWRGVGAAD